MTGSPRSMRATFAAVAAAIAIGGLLALAWTVPATAVVIAWPLFFLVPGWALVAALTPRLGTSARLGLAIVLSVAISAHLVYWLSQLGGYRRETVFAAAALLALPLPAAIWLRGPQALAGQLRGSLRAARRELVPLAFALASALFVGGVLWAGVWRPVPGGVAAGGSNWSDLGVHLSIAQSVNAGNFPPDVPFFAGAPLVYHWFADFHAAIVAEAAGIFAVPAFIVSSAILAGALALLVHGLARLLLRVRAARRAALLAAALVIFGGGLGWIRLVSDLANGYGDLAALVAHNSYDNAWYDALGQASWPYFRIPSVMGTGLLVHRATTAGLPILVGAILLLVAGLPTRRRLEAGDRDRPRLIAASGLLGALLAPFHFFFFPAFLLLALLVVGAGRRLVDPRAPRNAALLLAPMLLALPFALPALLQSGGSGAMTLRLGWESAPLDDGGAAVVFFYLTNLGVPFLLALVALLTPGLPHRPLMAGWLLTLFLIPNLVQVSEVGFDMNKYFQAMWIGAAIATAWLIRRWPWPAVALVLALSIPSPLLVAAWTGLSREQVLSTAEVRVAGWMSSETPERSVFVTDGWLNAPTDPAGRLRLMTYAPYVANLGYDPEPRLARIHEIYCGGDAGRAVALMREEGADYLVEDGLPADCRSPTDFATAPDLALVYEADGIRVWRIADGPAPAS